MEKHFSHGWSFFHLLFRAVKICLKHRREASAFDGRSGVSSVGGQDENRPADPQKSGWRRADHG
jgi:hypothetical protein